MVITFIIPRLSPLWPAVIPPYWLWPLFGRGRMASIVGCVLVVYLLAFGVVASVALTVSQKLLHDSQAEKPKTLAGYGFLWLRRIVGTVLLLAGVVLLALPAPGVLAILCGLIFGDVLFFQRVERRLRRLVQRIRGGPNGPARGGPPPAPPLDAGGEGN